MRTRHRWNGHHGAFFVLRASGGRFPQDQRQVSAAAPQFDTRRSSDDFDAKFRIIQNHMEIIRALLSRSCAWRARGAATLSNVSKSHQSGAAPPLQRGCGG
jgi:hypothetical protein